MCMERGDQFLRFAYTLVWLLPVVIDRKLVQTYSEDCINYLIFHKEVTFEVFLTEA